jgi:hypothetical protein
VESIFSFDVRNKFCTYLEEKMLHASHPTTDGALQQLSACWWALAF